MPNLSFLTSDYYHYFVHTSESCKVNSGLVPMHCLCIVTVYGTEIISQYYG